MTDEEQYEFDRCGYLIIKNMLDAEELQSLAEASEKLLAHAVENIDLPPRKKSRWGAEYHQDEELGYHAFGKNAPGETILVEDFFNADPAFDCLVNHQRTMDYITPIVKGRPSINNSELRIRYQDNSTVMHMGGPVGSKYRYSFIDGRIDCMMIRMIYFIHDVSKEEGAFCVVPGTHKSEYKAPYYNGPDKEPGVVALEVKAGDAILFTENLRHGGVTNFSEQTRKTLHVGYGPFWLKSQNISTMDEDQYILEKTLERYDDEQKLLFLSYEQPHT
ncbi:MAG: phytanoyl-CoA dioxygenase family protein [Lentisphaeria bacterium]|nr:phytanoyl-CoA dioxygenase family protein [Lentisphaeria bacterium]NQZ70891.1 phytanoyl-CoA dioxygenase family protein [Lentisphaeria bacterium]